VLANGYAIAPLSLHVSGRRYAWITPLVELGFLPDAPSKSLQFPRLLATAALSGAPS
jgi:hypothetical protein